jgi:hypothetical protein
MGRKSILIGLFLLCRVFALQAQTPTFTAYVNQNPIEVGDRFKLTFELTNTKGNITPPSLVDFQILFGPATSQSYQFVNGQSSSSLSYTYTLMALKEGDFTIDPAKAETEEGTLNTKPLIVRVVKTSGQTQSSNNTTRQNQQQQFKNNTQAQQQPAGETDVDTRGNQNIFIRIELDKSRVYEGEGVKASYVLYSRYNAVELGEFATPSLTGFYSQEIKSENNSWDASPATINGMRYRRARLKEMMLYPQQFGNLKIESIDMTCTVNRSFFNPGTSVRIKSNSPTLTVKRLPSPQPGNFSGFTGDFKATASVSSNTVPANEAITLKVKITGSGNLSLIQAPKINFPDDFEVYDPKVNNKFKTTSNGTSGTKEFEYLVIPRYEGQYELAAFDFVYFNTNQNKYVTEKMGPFSFSISKGSGNNQGATVVMSNKSDVQLLGKDIRYIKYETELRSKNRQFFNSMLFWILFFLPIIGLVVSYLLLRKKQADLSDVTGTKKKKASKFMAKQLAQAKNLINGDDKPFYEALFKGINQYLADKLVINPAELTKENIKNKLTTEGAGESEIKAIIEVLDQCEMARFAPMTSLSKEDLFKAVSNTIATINQQIK